MILYQIPGAVSVKFSCQTSPSALSLLISLKLCLSHLDRLSYLELVNPRSAIFAILILPKFSFMPSSSNAAAVRAGVLFKLSATHSDNVDSPNFQARCAADSGRDSQDFEEVANDPSDGSVLNGPPKGSVHGPPEGSVLNGPPDASQSAPGVNFTTPEEKIRKRQSPLPADKEAGAPP